MTELTREEVQNPSAVVAASVLTIISGVLALLPAITLLLVLQLGMPSWRVPDLISFLFIGGVAIAGGITMLTKKSLMFVVIGATIPLGTFFYGSLIDLMILANINGMEPSNALPDIIGYFVAPFILGLSILSLALLAKSRTPN